jgi:hypothetical protein
MKVRAATRGHGPHAQWKVRTLSAPGDSQRAHAAIGEDGTAAVAWSATSTSFDAIRMATTDADRPLAPWVFWDVVTGVPIGIDPDVVVSPRGRVTVIWQQGGRLWTRFLAGASLGGPVAVSPSGVQGVLDAFLVRPDGRAAMLYQLYGAGPESLGLRFRVLNDGVPGAVAELTGDDETDGDENSAILAIDGRSRGFVVYTRGTYPDTDFAWLHQAP